MRRNSNFDHLEQVDPGLAALGSFAERYFVDDPNTALIKSRQFAERLTILIAGRAGVAAGPRDGFSDLLRAVQAEGSAPREVVDVLHRLRRFGNDAAHGTGGERRDALEAIKLCHRLGVWWRATRTGKPGLTIAFVPPRPQVDDSIELKAAVATLQARLAEAETAAERHAREAKEAWDARMSAEERTRLAEEERGVYEALAIEAEQRVAAAAPTAEQRMDFIVVAANAARNLDLDEADTRLLIDDQLRQAGWQADTLSLRHGAGSRPEKGRAMAIAE